MGGVEKPRNPGMLLSPGDLSNTSILYHTILYVITVLERCSGYPLIEIIYDLIC
jgi:hypothetical protein